MVSLSRMIGLTLWLSLAGCATSVVLPADSGATFDPIAFFTGQTKGEGELNKLLSSPVNVLVSSVGRRQNGMLVLDQTIREGNEPPRVRRWTMRQVAPNRYTGSLTDALGPVHITVSGPRAYIRYKMDGGLGVEQQLALQSDGRTLLNRLQVEKFGVRVADLAEVIRKAE